MAQPETRVVPDVITTSSPIRALAFHTGPDGRDLRIVSGDKEAVRVWRLENDWRWQQLGWAEARDVRCVAASRDGRWIAAGKSWGETTVWDSLKLKKAQAATVAGSSDVPILEPVFTDNDGHTITSVDFSPIDPTRLVIASGGRTASIWDIANNKRLAGPLQHAYWVVAAKFSPDGRYIATATYHRKSVQLYNSDDGSWVAEFPASTNAYYNTGLLWSHNSIFVLAKNTIDTKTDNKTITTITIKQFKNPSSRPKNPKPDSEWEVTDSNCPCIASPNPEQFIVFSAYGGIKILRTSAPSQNTQDETVLDASQDVLSMAVSPDGQFLATGDWDGKDVGSIMFTKLKTN